MGLCFIDHSSLLLVIVLLLKSTARYLTLAAATEGTSGERKAEAVSFMK